jgi:hypothetical protein
MSLFLLAGDTLISSRSLLSRHKNHPFGCFRISRSLPSARKTESELRPSCDIRSPKIEAHIARAGGSYSRLYEGKALGIVDAKA